METIRKATFGALVSGLGALVTALADDGVTKLEWAVIAFTVASTLATVYGVKNQSENSGQKIDFRDNSR